MIPACIKVCLWALPCHESFQMINLLFDLMQLSMGALVTQIRDSNLVHGTRARILQQAQQSSNAIDSAGHGQVDVHQHQH